MLYLHAGRQTHRPWRLTRRKPLAGTTKNMPTVTGTYALGTTHPRRSGTTRATQTRRQNGGVEWRATRQQLDEEAEKEKWERDSEYYSDMSDILEGQWSGEDRGDGSRDDETAGWQGC